MTSWIYNIRLPINHYLCLQVCRKMQVDLQFATKRWQVINFQSVYIAGGSRVIPSSCIRYLYFILLKYDLFIYFAYLPAHLFMHSCDIPTTSALESGLLPTLWIVAKHLREVPLSIFGMQTSLGCYIRYCLNWLKSGRVQVNISHT